jgi:5-hydroxyisourate hydrolase-like protein (transthyretin family)
MKVGVVVLTLFLQAGRVISPPAPRGSISGVVLHNATGDPLANVSVTLAKVDIPLAASKLLRQVIRQNPDGGPQAEVMVPVEMLEQMKAEMAAIQKNGGGDLPPEMALMAALPLEDIHTITVDPVGKLGLVPKSAPPVTTDGSGRFSFRDLEPGTYRLIFAANGFVRQDYSPAGGNGVNGGVPVLLEAGKSIDGLVARLTPTGGVSGRISDGSGQPAAFVRVRLTRLAFDATGKRKLTSVLSVQTDDRGEYRFFYLTPGRYYISAGNAPGERFDAYGADYFLDLSVSGGAPNQNHIADQRYMLSFYPGTPEPAAATPIDVRPGTSTTDVDIVLASQGLYTIRGRIIDPRGGPPAQAQLRLTTLDSEAPGAGLPINRGQSYNPADGVFELREVPSGSYVLMADLQGRITLPVPSPNPSMTDAERLQYNAALRAGFTADQAAPLKAFVTITVGNSDVDGVVISPGVGGLLDGRLRFEGALPQGVAVELRPMGPDGLPARLSPYTPQSQQVRPDGAFRITGIYPGEYWMRVIGLPSGAYVKSARFGDNDALNRPIALTTFDSNVSFDIVISSQVGQLEGVARDADGHPAAGAQVVLIPDQNRGRVELFRAVTADGAGRYVIPDVEPGEYHVGVWQSLDPYAYFDPENIRLAQENGRAVSVAESSSQTVNLETLR